MRKLEQALLAVWLDDGVDGDKKFHARRLPLEVDTLLEGVGDNAIDAVRDLVNQLNRKWFRGGK